MQVADHKFYDHDKFITSFVQKHLNQMTWFCGDDKNSQETSLCET